MDQRQLFLRDVLTVLFKRKFLIAFFALVVFVVVFAGNYVWPPTYESVARVRLIEGREQLMAPATVTRSAVDVTTAQLTVEDVHSEIEIIYGDDVLEAVVQALNLDKRSAISGGISAAPSDAPAGEPSPQGEAGLPENDEVGLDQAEARADAEAARRLSEVFGSLAGEANPVRIALRAAKQSVFKALYLLNLKAEPDETQKAVNGLRRAIEVKPIEKSFVLEVRCRYSDPEAAQIILETLLRKFQRKHLEVFAQPESQQFIEEQLDRVTKELAKAQEDLKLFRNENDLLEVDVEREQLVDLYSKAKRVLMQVKQLATATARVDGEGVEGASIIGTLSRETDSIVINELRLKLLEKIQRKYEIMQSKGPRHPERIGIGNEIEKALADLREALSLTEQITSNEIGELGKRLDALNGIMARNDQLEQRVKIKSEAVEDYFGKLEEAIVADESNRFNISSIRTLSQPNMDVEPVSPRKLFNLLIAIIAGVIGGVGIAFFLEYLDHGLKTPEDVEHYVKTAPLASFFHGPYEQLDPKEAQRLSAMLEAAHPGTRLQLVQVASSIGGEGSHRVARALAEAAAQDPDRRTLLIDFVGDGIQEAPSGSGLMDVLEGNAELGDILGSLGNLYVLGRGSQRECPTYLWNSERMKALLEDLRTRFDRIIFHVAPILQSSDALNLARHADGAILVIRADSTRREVVLRGVEMLAEAKGRVLGAVLTDRKQVIPRMVYRRI